MSRSLAMVFGIFIPIRKQQQQTTLNNQIITNTKRQIRILEGKKEGNVLFNDALNTFYFTVIWRRTYGKGPFRYLHLAPRILCNKYVVYTTIKHIYN